MPAALVKALSEETGISIDEAEKRWEKAKEIAAAEEHNLTEADGETYWKYVVGVFKRSMGVMEDAPSSIRPRNAYGMSLNDIRQRVDACRNVTDLGETILVLTASPVLSWPFRTMRAQLEQIDDPGVSVFDKLVALDIIDRHILIHNAQLKPILPDDYQEKSDKIIADALAEIKDRGRVSREKIRKSLSALDKAKKRALDEWSRFNRENKGVPEEKNKMFSQLCSDISDMETKTYRTILTGLAAQSPITKQQANQWVKESVRIHPEAGKCIGKSRVPVPALKEMLALFYRATGGKLPAVEFQLAKGARSFSQPDQCIVYISNKPGNIHEGVIFHELGHIVETNPTYLKLALGWLNSRIKHPPEKINLRKLTGQKFYDDDEEAFINHFWDPYIGKDYQNRATEVFATGMQRLCKLQTIHDEIENDTDHWDFILGVMGLPPDQYQRDYAINTRWAFQNRAA